MSSNPHVWDSPLSHILAFVHLKTQTLIDTLLVRNTLRQKINAEQMRNKYEVWTVSSIILKSLIIVNFVQTDGFYLDRERHNDWPTGDPEQRTHVHTTRYTRTQGPFYLLDIAEEFRVTKPMKDLARSTRLLYQSLLASLPLDAKVEWVRAYRIFSMFGN